MKVAKLHGAGNDFLLVEGMTCPALDARPEEVVRRLCHRRFGVGADGVLELWPLGEQRARLVYWNADGSPAAFCANGTRCAARFIAERWGWTEMTLQTGHAAVPARVVGREVSLRLPAPEAVGEWQDLVAGAETFTCRYVSVGVPHLIVPVSWLDFWEHPLEPGAPALRHHGSLPSGGANVSVVRRSTRGLQIRSWERGVEGETLSCGSGAVAAAVVALADGWVRGPAEVLTASGRILRIEAEGTPPLTPVRLTGPAEWVGEIEVAPELLAG